MPIAGINSTELNSISQINTIEKSAIDGVNSVSLPSSFAIDYSIEGNGSNQYISLGNQENTGLNPTEAQINSDGYTWTSWVYIDDFSTSFTVFALGVSGTTSYYGINMLVNRFGKFVFHFFGLNGSSPGGGTNNRITKSTQNSTISSGQWYHLGVVVPANGYDDNTTWKMYINGSEYTGTYINSGNANMNLAYSGNSNLGAWQRSGTSLSNVFDGEINNAAIFNKGLDASNMAAIYNSGTPIDLSSNSGNYTESAALEAWWRFNEGTGTSYTDSTGNGYTGTGVNTPTWSANVPT